jgi:hypothetical protein
MELIERRAPVDDLTPEAGACCARCGSGVELDRPVALLLDGRWLGEIVCSPCLAVRSTTG